MRPNESATASIVVDFDQSLSQQAQFISSQLSVDRLDAVLCVAGGWAGGKIDALGTSHR